MIDTTCDDSETKYQFSESALRNGIPKLLQAKNTRLA